MILFSRDWYQSSHQKNIFRVVQNARFDLNFCDKLIHLRDHFFQTLMKQELLLFWCLDF
jgi:hypothetical protein